MQECVNGIRSCAILPGEVATPILDKRPVPVSPEERARMVQPEDVADLILYLACLPPHVVINEVMITPTWNRAYVAALGGRSPVHRAVRAGGNGSNRGTSRLSGRPRGNGAARLPGEGGEPAALFPVAREGGRGWGGVRPEAAARVRT